MSHIKIYTIGHDYVHTGKNLTYEMTNIGGVIITSVETEENPNQQLTIYYPPGTFTGFVLHRTFLNPAPPRRPMPAETYPYPTRDNY